MEPAYQFVDAPSSIADRGDKIRLRFFDKSSTQKEGSRPRSARFRLLVFLLSYRFAYSLNQPLPRLLSFGLKNMHKKNETILCVLTDAAKRGEKRQVFLAIAPVLR